MIILANYIITVFLIKKKVALFVILVIFITGGIFIIVYNLLSPSKLIANNLDIDLQYNAGNSYIYIKNQTMDIGNRIPGTNKSKECIRFFISKFHEIDSNFSYYYHNFSVLGVNCSNILFKLNKEKEHIIILGAHFDSRARATKDSGNINQPVPGANDGASGCAALIELARIFYSKRNNLSAQIWFLFFDAEDQGIDESYGIYGWDWCEGSKRFVNQLDNFYNSNDEIIDCMILLDMIGGTGLEFINEQYSTSSLLDEIFVVGRALGYTHAFPSNPTVNSIIDDHKAFVDANIPSADLIINFWNNPSWPFHHTLNDTINHISNESLTATGKTIEQFVYNNYLDVPWNTYRGNFPWTSDKNLLNTEIIFQILILIGFVSVGIIIYLVYQHQKSKSANL